jgi:hypothetical protein
MSRVVAPVLLLMPVVVVSAKALRILIFEKEQPLTDVWLDVIDVACGYSSTLNCTLSAERLLNEPMPSD